MNEQYRSNNASFRVDVWNGPGRGHRSAIPRDRFQDGCHRRCRRTPPLTAAVTNSSNPFQAKTWIADCLKITPIQRVLFDNGYWCKNWALHLLVWSRLSCITLWRGLWTLRATAPQATLFFLYAGNNKKRANRACGYSGFQCWDWISSRPRYFPSCMGCSSTVAVNIINF